jgi:flavin reductase (DIM6/NTAB) family NADH-FMN oxidoreductase RutF
MPSFLVPFGKISYMINYEALFKISYGLFIISSGDKELGNGFISNSVMQVTAEPPQFAICCNKNNYTAEFIKNSKVFSVSILHSEVAPEIFGRFGYRSGRDFNKLEGLNLRYGEGTGVPVVLNDTLAFLECRLVQTIDVGTHFLFIGVLLNSEILDESREPITYDYYRKVRKGVAPKNAPTYVDKSKVNSPVSSTGFKKYQCTACDYIYDEAVEGIKFGDLPADWECPNCGSGKEFFVEIS